MINRCPISYDKVSSQGVYSPRGLSILSRKLLSLKALPFTVEEQLFEAARRSGRMSIQGVQPKLSAVLSPKEESFLLVDSGGKYILKPQNSMYPHLPENEDLTMKLAHTCGIEVPPHGMVWCKDDSLTYWILLRIPDQSYHSFRNKPATYSGQSCHSFRLKVATFKISPA